MRQAEGGAADRDEWSAGFCAAALVRLPARVFHAALASNGPAIDRSGLKSASTLMLSAGLSAAEQRRYRDETTTLPGGIALRDQRPMEPSILAPCLDPPLSAADWYQILNARLYFWIDEQRLERYLTASAAYDQIIYVVDTYRLVDRYAEYLEVTPFNVGYAKRLAARRGQRSFVKLSDWIGTSWVTEAPSGSNPRPSRYPPVEIAVGCSIPDFDELVIDRRFKKATRRSNAMRVPKVPSLATPYPPGSRS